MAIMNEVHDIITSKNGLCSVFAILSFSLRICMVLDTLANLISQFEYFYENT